MMTPEQIAATHPPTCPERPVLASVCHHCKTGTPFSQAQLDTFAWGKAWREAKPVPGVHYGRFDPIPGADIYRMGRDEWLRRRKESEGR